MPYFDLPPDNKIFYSFYPSDSRAAVVLIHGLGANSLSWELQIEPLRRAGYTVMCPDMRGFGLSRSARPASIIQMAEDIAELLNYLHIQRANLVGISMGGAIALQFALNHPQMLKSLVLVNTFARFSLNKPSMWIYYGLRFLFIHVVGLKLQAEIVAKRVFPKPDQEFFRKKFIEQILQSDPKAYRNAMRSLARFNVLDKLHLINTPTLVISGEEDTSVPLSIQTEMARNIPDCQHVTIPGSGHASSVDAADAFNACLLQFLLKSDPI